MSLVCASTGYLLARGEPRHPDDLARHRAVICARRDEEVNTRWTINRAGERQAIHAVFPSHCGMRSAKVQLYTAYVAGLLDAAPRRADTPASPRNCW